MEETAVTSPYEALRLVFLCLWPTAIKHRISKIYKLLPSLMMSMLPGVKNEANVELLSNSQEGATPVCTTKKSCCVDMVKQSIVPLLCDLRQHSGVDFMGSFARFKSYRLQHEDHFVNYGLHKNQKAGQTDDCSD